MFRSIIIILIFASTLLISAVAAERTPFEVLGIDKNATELDIKKAYRAMAMHIHQNSNLTVIEKEFRIKELNIAKDELADPNKRDGWRAGNTYDFQNSDFVRKQQAERMYMEMHVYGPSEFIVREVAKHHEKDLTTLTNLALHLLRESIRFEGVQAGRPLNLRTLSVYDIVTRTGIDPAYSGDHINVTEAVYRAAFLFLKDIEPIHKETADRMYERFYEDVEVRARLTAGMPTFADSHPMLVRVVRFAQLSRTQNWNHYLNSPTCEVLLLTERSQSEKILEPARASKGRVRSKK